jgi:hypothetical protein
MTGHGAKFGRKREEAIAALLTHRTVEEAAKSIDIATKTLLRWMQLPEFKAAYREARRDAFGQCIARLQYGSTAAASTILKIMVDANAPASSRLRAAETVITQTIKAVEIEDIEARVAAIERSIKERESAKR